ncbi:ComEC/Rec2 family competence protein [Mitsuokella jalaludinii]|uniref:ComEC/Rec2 family competence protein n=1 Tax=Mitsuokella jalaludinii TaxID=187979 RepID=UPI002431D70B|nr:MBL fold metallo-hydrolase [Mitsuokella jalaludinii]
MSKYEDPTQLDYRYGGDTVDDFAQKYMKTVAYIFSALNELRSPTGGTLTQNPEAYQLKVDDNKLYIRNQANTDWILLGDVQENFGFRTSASDAFMHESDVADSGTAGKLIRADASGKLNADILGNAAKIADKAIQMGLDLADEDRLVYDKDTDTITNCPRQFKVDGDKIYARKDATTGWVLLGDLKQNLGFRSSTDDAFLTESDVADNGTAGKLIRADVNGKLNADILGNARKMAGKTFAPEDLQDGQIPVYRTSDGTWHAENKGTVGTGKNLMIMDGDKMLGEYNGDEMKAIDIQKSSLTKALAESTGYGIVSGCEPSISGLTVTVGAGVVHLSDGTRKEMSATNITLNNADGTNPRIDLVYIDSTGAVAKVTGTASATPVVPALPTGGISVCNVTIAANAANGFEWDIRRWNMSGNVEFLFPRTESYEHHGDCELIKTTHKTMMIDAGNVDDANVILEYCIENGIKQIDIFLLTHYHEDHYANIQQFINQSNVDFSKTIWMIPPKTIAESESGYALVKSWLENAKTFEINDNMTFELDRNVLIELYNMSPADQKYHGNDLNNRSVYALVRHGNVKVLYTGDGYGTEHYLYSIGKYEKIDLLKVPHHGVSAEGSGNFYYLKKISPQIALCNLCFEHGVSLNGGDYLSKGGVQTQLAALGCKIGYLMKGNAKYISDGVGLNDCSDVSIYEPQNSFTPTTVDVYVDPATTEKKPDGTQSKPFKTLRHALCAIPDHKNILPVFHLADGTYEYFIYSSGRNNPIRIVGENVTIGTAQFYNFKYVEIGITNFISRDLEFYNTHFKVTKVTINALKDISIRIENSQGYIGNCEYNGSPITYTANTRGILMLASNVCIDRLNIHDTGKALVVKQSSIFSSFSVSAANISTLINVVDAAGGVVQINRWGTMSNVTTYIAGFSKFIDCPSNR